MGGRLVVTEEGFDSRLTSALDTLRECCEQQGSAVSALNAWTTAGFPASQIVLGVASYGHSFSVSNADALSSDTTSGSGNGTLKLYPQFNKANQPAGDSWDGVAGETDVCGNPTTVGGIFNFWGLIEGGFLTANGTAADGMVYTFDDCSQTVRTPPFQLFYPSSGFNDGLLIIMIYFFSLSC